MLWLCFVCVDFRHILLATMLYPEFSWAYQDIYLLCAWVKLKGSHHGWWALLEFRVSRLAENALSSLAWGLFTNIVRKNLASIFGHPYWFNKRKIHCVCKILLISNLTAIFLRKNCCYNDYPKTPKLWVYLAYDH